MQATRLGNADPAPPAGETAEPAGAPAPVHAIEEGGRRMDDKEFHELKKEIIEARNLVIKTDNLLKNLHAELKLVARRQDEFARRQVLTSATAMGIVAVLCAGAAVGGAWTYVKSWKAQALEARKSADEAARTLDEMRARVDGQKRSSESAARVHARLASDKAEERAEALAALAKVDRAALMPLEVAALDARAAQVRAELAAAALERGKAAFRREDWKAAEKELARYVELDPAGEELLPALFQLGSARFSLKDYAGATGPLERFVSQPQGQRNVDWAYWLLGQAYEESGQAQKAQDAYTRGLAHFGQSQFAPMMRRKLQKLTEPAAPAAPAPAPTPPAPAVPTPPAGP